MQLYYIGPDGWHILFPDGVTCSWLAITKDLDTAGDGVSEDRQGDTETVDGERTAKALVNKRVTATVDRAEVTETVGGDGVTVAVDRGR